MAEETLASGHIFSDPDLRRFSFNDDANSFSFRDFTSSPPEPKKNEKKSNAISVPVKVPERVIRCRDECGDGAMEPPHLIIERRIARKMAFSVCSGNGRTLKGRDLSEVRNSILRLTGFLET